MKEETAVATTVEKLRMAMISGDAIVLTKLVDDDLSYGHSNGYVEGKEEFIEKLASGKSNFEQIDLAEQSIKITDKIAVVRHKFYAQTNDGGKGVGTVNLSILLIFHKVIIDWKLLARQAVRI